MIPTLLCGMLSISNLILASASPRRVELLKSIISEFQVIPSDVDEVFDPEMEKAKVAEYLAQLKAQSVFDLNRDKDPMVIGADTIVLNKVEILGKPKNRDDAFQMIRSMCATEHEVITGVSIISKSHRIAFSEITEVSFYEMTDKEIYYYIDNYEVMDKAGAYAIQDWIGQSSIKSIKGDFFNVVGLPVSRVYQNLKQLSQLTK